MKRCLSLLLALFAVFAVVPAFPLQAEAAATDYIVYQQDFNSVDSTLTDVALLGQLGWSIPDAKLETHGANYSINNGALRVSSTSATGESFVNIFSSEVMGILRNSNFTISYSLKYVSSSSTSSYAAIIYNYNEMHGSTANGEGNAAYGIAATRANGKGFNSVYYPVYGETCEFNPIETGSNATYASTPTSAFTMTVSYNYTNGVTVKVGSSQVSTSNVSGSADRVSTINDKYLWKDFLQRNDASTIALLTQKGLVVEIDNIKITSTSTEALGVNKTMPKLLITEMCARPNGGWCEFIEIHNPTSSAVDLANYSIIYANNVFDGSAIDGIKNPYSTREIKYSNYVNLGDVFGKPALSKQYILSEQEIAKRVNTYGADSIQYVDSTKYNSSGGTYSSGTVYRKVYKADPWNTRYKQGASGYNNNTLLNPGDTAVIFFMQDGDAVWNRMTNYGNTEIAISEKESFRSFYKDFGLKFDTKIICVSSANYFNLADDCQRRYLIGDAKSGGSVINYKSRYVTDLSNIVSYIDYNGPMVGGVTSEDCDPNIKGNLGLSGQVDLGFSAAYVYGIDGSRDQRAGTLYSRRINIKTVSQGPKAHIGELAGYQEIILDAFYGKSDGKMAPLSITEIMPLTQNLAGQDKNAFSAVELTNTSSAAVNVYDYALVRTNTNNNCLVGEGFNTYVKIKPGNPVEKVTGNGAYYYFMGEHVANPAECILQPGETVVLWFMTADTYASYSADDDFGADYFRQYWANNGCYDLAVKDANGDYSVKVLAIDACADATYNASNAEKLFNLVSNAAAIYGVANATEAVFEHTGKIPETEVVSIAPYVPLAMCFELNWEELPPDNDGVVYYANVLRYSKFPVNKGMRYVVGLNYTAKISAMRDTLKVQYYQHNFQNSAAEKFSKNPDAIRWVYNTTSIAIFDADLGTLDGVEAYCKRASIFKSTSDGYKYNDSSRFGVTTLEGAAVPVNGKAPYLRFDNAVRSDVLSALVGAYGTVKVGMLVVKSDDLRSGVELTKAGLDKAGISYTDVAGKAIYAADGMVVFGSYFTVADKSTSYTAVGYMTVNGVTYWSTASTERSVKDVAKDAIADIRTASADKYVNEVAEGKFSYYSTDAYQALVLLAS